ncbi:glycogen synthase GlgA [Methylophaga sp. OBS3]|uniref:glycogen synthase GlgA n=1 Tax=Methylophaga sp. OBS3 TaxID=2991934 RepID=UPI00224D4C60|nr:glycogen synthase GlgA [Methylophaga sp. OBS3]MCX4188703.1 glycogen synthase GlgA [Methylophaga sp. OBS3]
MRKILFASSEVTPLMKTGGLADVSASLPIALHEQAQDVRVVMPAYRKTLQRVGDYKKVATIKVNAHYAPVHILETVLPDSDVICWLIDSPDHFDRDAGPYGDENGHDWADNAARFALFCRAVVAIAQDQAGLDWQPDLVHCNDWQTGLVPALLSFQQQRPATIFTIHNLAYQGLFSRDVFDILDLPDALWRMEGIEFYGLMSFMKGGLAYADHVTTVSPTYAEEICEYEFGYGLEGLLQWLADEGKLTGIVNGIDTKVWDPATDPAIEKNYSAATIRFKAANKQALQQYFGLPDSPKTLMMGLVSRLVAQKGVDLSIQAIDRLMSENADIQLVCLGSGEAGLEQELRVLRARYPDRVGLQFGYDENLAHQIEAGVDVFLMPSRFEPCGLNQLYSLRYGTLPVVRNTGGLADTVIDATEDNRKNNTATGFIFSTATSDALVEKLYDVIALYEHPRLWRRMILTAMLQDVSWAKSASRYLDLYKQLTA